MKITEVKNCPPGLNYFDKDDLESKLEPQDIEDIVEIFQTPLTGSYNWDYTDADNRLKKLYELGKKLNWNATMDLDWSNEHYSHSDWATTPEHQQLAGFKPYDDLSEEKKIEVSWHLLGSSLSQIVHGEQGALLVASQLVSCAPTYNAKLYAASQTFDEARHVEAFNKYIQTRTKLMYPVGNELKSILDKILTDERWDLKFIGMQIIIEGLALAAFQSSRDLTPDPVLKDMLGLIIRDEARHVTFGVNYLEDFISTLSEDQIEERAQFAYEACLLSRERLVSNDVFDHFGWDKEESRIFQQSSDITKMFQKLLFQRIVPNLSRIGLLTDSVRGKFDKLGLLEYEDAQSDIDVDWADLSRPLFEDSA